MANLRPNKILNLVSATLVLVAGFYVILFMPINISPATKALIGLLLIIYFLIRLRHYKKKYGADNNRPESDKTIGNKGLDKNTN